MALNCVTGDKVKNQVRRSRYYIDKRFRTPLAKHTDQFVGIVLECRIDLTPVPTGRAPSGLLGLRNTDSHPPFGQMQRSRQACVATTDYQYVDRL
ncbi:hypothetical protein CS8_024150 [Cupriavidus sp. 8B]